MINPSKYDKKIFSKNPSIDKKIKALFLLFDKNVDEGKLGYKQSMWLIDYWIGVLVKREEYEIADAFQKRKRRKRNKWKKINRIFSVELFYRTWRRRINRML